MGCYDVTCYDDIRTLLQKPSFRHIVDILQDSLLADPKQIDQNLHKQIFAKFYQNLLYDCM